MGKGGGAISMSQRNERKTLKEIRRIIARENWWEKGGKIKLLEFLIND